MPDILFGSGTVKLEVLKITAERADTGTMAYRLGKKSAAVLTAEAKVAAAHEALKAAHKELVEAHIRDARRWSRLRDRLRKAVREHIV